MVVFHFGNLLVDKDYRKSIIMYRKLQDDVQYIVATLIQLKYTHCNL